MADLKIYTDENLARKGRDFVRRGQFALANEFLSEYCARMLDQEKTIPPAVLGAYGLAVGMTTDLKEGIEICHRALNADRKNPEIYLNLARLHAQSGSRKRAVEAIERGLALSKSHRGLLDLLQDLGQRQSPPVPFLGRDNPVNVKLGRLLHRLRGTGRDKSKRRVIA